MSKIKTPKLLDVIKNEMEVEWYLQDVSLSEFKKDVQELASANSDKDFIISIIEQLKSRI